MGGPNKLLLPWGCSTVVGSVVGALRQCDIEIIVVTGRDAEKVAQAVEPVKTVYNDRYQQGMGTSIAKGVSASKKDNAILITLGDMPELDSQLVLKLISNLSEPSEIVVPIYEDEPDRIGHPVLFGADFTVDLCELGSDKGAKSVIDANEQQIKRISFEGSLSDIDTANDIQN